MGVIIIDGRVLQQRDRFYVRLKRSKEARELPPEAVAADVDLASIAAADAPVSVALDSEAAGASILALNVPVATRPVPRWRWILCYIPAPELLRKVDPAVRATLLDEMVRLKVIPRSLAAQVRRR